MSCVTEDYNWNTRHNLVKSQIRLSKIVKNIILEHSSYLQKKANEHAVAASRTLCTQTHRKQRHVPRGYWCDLHTQRAALESLGREKLGVKSLDDWYSVSLKDVKQELSFITTRYKDSLFAALKKLYPHHNWDPLRRCTQVPRGHWSSEHAQRDALERLGREKLGVKELDDWYAVNAMDVKKELSFIYSHYSGSLFTALKKLYPHHNWDPLKLSKHVPKRYWSDEHAQRDALERLGREKFGVKELDDWYSVHSTDVKKELSFISTHYNSSLLRALKKLYPQHNWNPLKFCVAPQGYWKKHSTMDEMKNLIDSIRQKYNITALHEWQNMSREDLMLFTRTATALFGGKEKLLRTWYPNHSWADDTSSSAPERKLRVSSSKYCQLMNTYSGDVGIDHSRFVTFTD
jgi:hypothetical protein